VPSFIEIFALSTEISPYAEQVLTDGQWKDGRPDGRPENTSLLSPIVGGEG